MPVHNRKVVLPENSINWNINQDKTRRRKKSDISILVCVCGMFSEKKDGTQSKNLKEMMGRGGFDDVRRRDRRFYRSVKDGVGVVV